MGWEYHERPRDFQGRYARKKQARPVHLHVRVDEETADELRKRANEAGEELGTFLIASLRHAWGLPPLGLPR